MPFSRRQSIAEQHAEARRLTPEQRRHRVSFERLHEIAAMVVAPMRTRQAREECYGEAALQLLMHCMGKPIGGSVYYTRLEMKRRFAKEQNRKIVLAAGLSPASYWEQPDRSDPCEPVDDRDAMERALREVGRLPRVERSAVQGMLDGESLAEQAEKEGVTRVAIGQRRKRGIEIIKQRMGVTQ